MGRSRKHGPGGRDSAEDALPRERAPGGHRHAHGRHAAPLQPHVRARTRAVTGLPCPDLQERCGTPAVLHSSCTVQQRAC
eukprot:365202-Chlamydomonas_euryale.AAC.15